MRGGLSGGCYGSFREISENEDFLKKYIAQLFEARVSYCAWLFTGKVFIFVFLR